MNRKEFIKKAILTVGAGLPLYSVVSSCNSDDGNGPTPTAANCLDNGTNVSIGSNHGHTMTVSKADVQAGTEKTYQIAGTSSHDHSVTISANQFQSLAQNNMITAVSDSGGGHTHSVTVTCA